MVVFCSGFKEVILCTSLDARQEIIAYIQQVCPALPCPALPCPALPYPILAVLTFSLLASFSLPRCLSISQHITLHQSKKSIPKGLSLVLYSMKCPLQSPVHPLDPFQINL